MEALEDILEELDIAFNLVKEREYTAYRVDAKFIIISLLDYIDAIPKDIELPTMPGFDRDFVNDFLNKR